MEIDLNKEWHPVTLPSKGALYDGKLPDGTLHITPWTVAQEEAIVRNSEGDQTDLTHDLLRANVRWPAGFTYEDLLITDQFFLLLNLRMISLLDFMTLPYECPKCKTISQIEVNLPEIMVKTAEDTDPEEPYSVFLPRRKVKVTIRQQRVGDLEAAERYLKASNTPTKELRRKFLYARQIETIDGESVPFPDRMKWISVLSLLDLNALANISERHATGVQGQYEVKCPKCESLDKSWVPPIHADFFRPLPTDVERACQLAEEN